MSDQGATAAPVRDDTVERGFRWYAVAVCATGVLAAIAVALTQPFEFTAATVPMALAFLITFAAAELLAVNVDVRSGISWTVSFTEIPLVVGLMVADFEVVLIPHLIAGIGVLVARGVDRRKLYNAGVLAIEVSVAYAVAAAVASGMEAVGTPWPAAFLGALSAPLASTLLAVVSGWVLRKQLNLSTGLRFMARVLVVGLINASIGVGGYLIVTGFPYGWLLVGLVTTGIAALLWAYSDLLREQRDIDALSDVGLMVARSGQLTDTGGVGEFGDDEWTKLADRIRDQLAARRVVLRLRLDGATELRTFVAGDPVPEAALAADDVLLRLPSTRPRHFRAVETSGEIRHSLDVRQAGEVLVAPLRSATQVLGVVEAHDRRSR